LSTFILKNKYLISKLDDFLYFYSNHSNNATSFKIADNPGTESSAVNLSTSFSPSPDKQSDSFSLNKK